MAEAISGMKWDEALRSVGIQLQILTFKEPGSRKQNRIPVGEPAGGLEEKGGADQVFCLLLYLPTRQVVSGTSSLQVHSRPPGPLKSMM